MKKPTYSLFIKTILTISANKSLNVYFEELSNSRLCNYPLIFYKLSITFLIPLIMNIMGVFDPFLSLFSQVILKDLLLNLIKI